MFQKAINVLIRKQESKKEYYPCESAGYQMADVSLHFFIFLNEILKVLKK